MFNLKSIALCCGLFLGAVDVHAQSAKAGISGFTVQLIDLDAADGIAPGLSFVSQSQHSHYHVLGEGLFDYQDVYGYGGVTRDDAIASLRSWVGQDALASEVQGHMAATSYQASSEWSGRFHLTPGTAAIFRAQTRVDSAFGSGWQALSQAGMFADLGDDSGFHSRLTGDAGKPPSAADGLLYGELRSGAGSTGADGYLGMYTSAWVVTSPVPEPGSGAMLLAGLAVMAGLALRAGGRARRMARVSGLPRLKFTAIAAVLALASGGAVAQNSASVSLAPWRYTLSDLAPLDGMAPSITLSSPGYTSIVLHGQELEGTSDDSGAPLYWADGANTASAWSLPAGAQAAVHSMGEQVIAHGLREFSFSLSPFTQVAFFQDGYQSASGLDGATGARATLFVDLISHAGSASGWDQAELQASGARGFTLFAAAASQGELASGTVRVEASSYVLVPVPEPEQYAMWLAGISVLFTYRKLRR